MFNALYQFPTILINL